MLVAVVFAYVFLSTSVWTTSVVLLTDSDIEDTVFWAFIVLDVFKKYACILFSLRAHIIPVFGVFLNMRVLFDTADVTAVCNVMCVVFEEATLMKLDDLKSVLISPNYFW